MVLVKGDIQAPAESVGVNRAMQALSLIPCDHADEPPLTNAFLPAIHHDATGKQHAPDPYDHESNSHRSSGTGITHTSRQIAYLESASWIS